MLSLLGVGTEVDVQGDRVLKCAPVRLGVSRWSPLFDDLLLLLRVSFFLWLEIRNLRASLMHLHIRRTG